MRAASISSEDRGYLYGDALFETVRVREDGVRWLDGHARRLWQSGLELGFPCAALREALASLASLACAQPGVWRLTVSRPGEGVAFGGEGSVCVRQRPFVPATRPKLGTMPGWYWPEDPLARHKSASYLRHVEARRRAQLRGFDDALLLSGQGQLGEATAASVLVACGHRLRTPPLAGILGGVTREGLLHFAGDAGFAVEEAAIGAEELADADEIILLSAVHGALAAASLEGRPLGDARARELASWLASVPRQQTLVMP